MTPKTASPLTGTRYPSGFLSPMLKPERLD